MSDGYTPIPDSVIEKLYQLDNQLARNEIAVLLFIARKTFGWGKQFEKISYSQFAKATGISRSNVWRTLHPLIKRKIIFRTGDHRKAFYGINKAVNEWQVTSPMKSPERVQGDITHEVSRSSEVTSPMKSASPPKTPSGDITSEAKVTSPMKSKVTSPVKSHIINKRDTHKKTPPKSEIWGKCLDLSLLFHQRQKFDGLNHQDFKKPLTEKTPVVVNGADTLEKLHRIEGESLEDIKTVLRFILTDTGDGTWTGWKNQVISLASLRTKGKSGSYKYFTVKNTMQKQSLTSPKENEMAAPAGYYDETGIWRPEK